MLKSNFNLEKRTFLKNLFAMGVAAAAAPRLSFGSALNLGSSDNKKPLIKARYYEEMPDDIVKCMLCPHECTLKNGQSGICRTRVNDGGTLYTTAYGNPIAIHIDPVEKKPFYHFYPSSKVLSFGTAGCNFRCLNCQNADISQTAPDDLNSLDYSPEKIIKTAREHNVESIAFTYTEATVFYEYMYDTAVLAKQAGLKTMVISNGFINPKPLKDLINVIDAFNIDLKAFDDKIYMKLCGGKLNPVLNTLNIILESGKWLEITHLMVTNYTDKADEFSKMTDWLVKNNFSNTPLHISRFYPAHKLMDLQPTDVNAMETCYKIAIDAGIKYVYTGNLRTQAHENTYCSNCKQLLISRVGFTAKNSGMENGKCSNCKQEVFGEWGSF